MCDNRLWTIFGFVLILTATLSGYLFRVQVMEGSEWKAQARGQQLFFEQTKGERGNIYMQGANGEQVLAATNRILYHVYISPRELRGGDHQKLAMTFAEVLDIEKEDILERLEKDNSFEVLKRDLTPEDLEKVRGVSGLHVTFEARRRYPEEQLASHILGFVGGEGVGQYGVEQYYENTISGGEGVREGLRSGWGSFVKSDSTQRGEDVVLTIDYNIQHFVEGSLEKAVESLNATGGSVLVGDPKTGEILAMANYPTFNPNRYSEISSENFNVFKNPAIQTTFEPGSVFKPITMAIALDRDAVKPEDTYYDSGEVRIHGRVVRNYDRRSYGEVTMSGILERSINTGIVYVKDQVGNEVFLDYLKKFGFFEKTGIDLHGEIHSPNRSFLEGHDINFATASYGQGIEITSMQLFKAFSAIANGGIPSNPHIVKKNIERSNILPEERIISPTASFLVTEMMVNTINDGFGSTAKVPGYHIAGKTGTAQVPWSKLGLPGSGYSDRTIQGFIGYAPAFDPEFVILVKIDNPYTRSAGASAAPVFREVAEYILEYKKIPYDYDPEK